MRRSEETRPIQHQRLLELLDPIVNSMGLIQQFPELVLYAIGCGGLQESDEIVVCSPVSQVGQPLALLQAWFPCRRALKSGSVEAAVGQHPTEGSEKVVFVGSFLFSIRRAGGKSGKQRQALV